MLCLCGLSQFLGFRQILGFSRFLLIVNYLLILINWFLKVWMPGLMFLVIRFNFKPFLIFFFLSVTSCCFNLSCSISLHPWFYWNLVNCYVWILGSSLCFFLFLNEFKQKSFFDLHFFFLYIYISLVFKLLNLGYKA
jgi:hypothetical protein